MIDKLKRFIVGEKLFMVCIDTSFISGTILKHIQKDTWKIKIKDDLNKRLKALNESKCLLLINSINEFEIKETLIKSFNTPIEKADKIYQDALSLLTKVKKIEIKEIHINPALINWMLKNRLSLKDGLLINISQKLKLPFVTSERNADVWKKAYSGVINQKEFWKELEKYGPA